MAHPPGHPAPQQWARLRGARIAGPPPALTDAPVRVHRPVSSRGGIQVVGQTRQVGFRPTGAIVVVEVDETSCRPSTRTTTSSPSPPAPPFDEANRPASTTPTPIPTPKDGAAVRAVLEVDAGVPVTEVAERFGVSRQAVHRWIGWYRDEGFRQLPVVPTHQPHPEPGE